MLKVFVACIFLCFIFVAEGAKPSKFINAGFWDIRSDVGLKALCTSLSFDMVIVNVQLALERSNVGSDSSFLLKMKNDSLKNARRYPHYNNFVLKDSGKASIRADYLDLTHLGESLRSCTEKGIKVLLQLTLGKGTGAIKIRQSILLHSLIWNSFLTEYLHADRPFGKDFRFDGIHIVFEKLESAVAPEGQSGKNRLQGRYEDNLASFMKGLRNMALEEKSNILLTTLLTDQVQILDSVVRESDYIVISDSNATRPPPKTPFIVNRVDSSLKEIFKKYSKNQHFTGVIVAVSNEGKLKEINGLSSRNPSFEEQPAVSKVFFATCSGIVLLVGFSVFIIVKYKLFWKGTKEKEKENGSN